MNRLIQQLSNRVDGDTVVWFRIVFGSLAACWVWKQFAYNAIQTFYVDPTLHFHYWGFEWVAPLPDHLIHAEFAVLGAAGVLVACGAFYRWATLVFALTFTHLFLMDKCLYQNHYYLICLLSWLLLFIPANRQFAVDAWLRPSIRTKTVPRWSVWLLRFQLALPYFYGGIAKLNSDWLAGEPMRSMLAQRTDFPIIGSFFEETWCVSGFVFGGLLFDLLVIPAILTTRFRLVAIGCAVFFHLMNARLFTIGVFPWLMLLSLPIFLPPGTLRRLLRGEVKPADITGPKTDATNASPAPATVALKHRVVWSLALLYIAWQLFLPLRHFTYPGNTSWTEEGHCFAWRMLVRGKQPALRILATDPATQRTGAMNLRNYVSEFQLHRVSRDPRLIHELAHYVGDDLKAKGYGEIAVRAFTLVSLNGRKPQLLVDPRIDLLAEDIGWQKPAWIVPLTEPLPAKAWDTPMSEWERDVEIPEAYRDKR